MKEKISGVVGTRRSIGYMPLWRRSLLTPASRFKSCLILCQRESVYRGSMVLETGLPCVNQRSRGNGSELASDLE